MKITVAILSLFGILFEVNDILELLKYQRELIASGEAAYGFQYHTQITGDFVVIFILILFCSLIFKM
jgi:hypothetical protein